MSQHLLQGYSEARRTHAVKSEARHIRAKINEARGSPHDAAVRWPFELLQNALDAGARAERHSVNVTLKQERSGLVFEHDGAFFKLQDLAALLSGGSSKDFDGAETTGRFGTGFLVTHVLAPSVQLSGLVDAGSHVERFELLLDRAGDEETIVKNIEHCNEAIARAEVVSVLDGLPSARFVYDRDDLDSIREGLATFRQALPYLFATCPLLGRARLELNREMPETWEAFPITSRAKGDATVQERLVRIAERGIEYRTVRVSSSDGTAAAVVALEHTHSGFRVIVPSSNFPRVFCRYPIRTSGFLPINVILDARFDLDQERRKILLGKDEVKELFHKALVTVLPLVGLASEEEWEQRHQLARVERSQGAFSDEGAERDWINEGLRSLADSLARMKLVETPRGIGAAVSDRDWSADFIRPRLTPKSDSDDTTIERMWGLVADAEHLYPPTKDLAEDWSAIASGWADLGVDVALVTLDQLREAVRGDATELGGLRLRCDRRKWLARFIDCVGECWTRRGAVTKGLLDRLLPDQNGRLASGADLRQDEHIPNELKDIAKELGIDVRARLLDAPLMDLLARPECAHGAKALREVVGEALTKDDVVRCCIDQLKKTMPEGRAIPDAARATVAGSIRLLDFLWKTRGETGVSLAKDVPLVTRDGKAVRVLPTQRVMAPVSAWPDQARPFSEVYPPTLVLDDAYAGTNAPTPDVLAALLKWGIVYAEPLVCQSIGGSDLKGERLKPIMLDRSVEVEGLALPQTTFSQIALLHQVLPRCAEAPDLAASLLGLILTYIAPNDPEWEKTTRVTAQRGKTKLEIELRPALWLGDILTRPWIPIIGEDDRRVVVPDHHAVRPILRAEWYAQNEAAIRLLSGFFGFGALELRLASVAPDEKLREKISDELSRVVSLFGANVERYGELAAQLEARAIAQRQRERFMNLGRAVQDAVEAALTSLGLNVRLVDCGYDFEIADDTVEDSSYAFEMDSVFVEVKATTTDRARMTPKQASTAANRADKYVLCVVDLRGLSDERLDQPWTTRDILELAKMIQDVGTKVRATWQLVEQARGGAVCISGESSLRYDVPASIWAQGCTIAEWLMSTRGKVIV